MKTIKMTSKSAALLVLAVAVATGCAIKKSDNAQTTQNLEDRRTEPNNDVPGQGSTSVPTQEAVIGRLLGVGLAGSGVTTTSTNTAAVILKVTGNLPQLTHPIKANGWDQIPFLTLAACADISNANAQSVYGVNIATGTLANQRTALIAAGVKFTDQYAGGMATGAFAAQVTQVFTTLVDQNALITGETVRQSFNSVCMAANVWGLGMRGF